MMRTSTTNEALAAVREKIEELITWAQSDAEHAEECDAPETAKDDRHRAKLLRKSLKLLEGCDR